jgi:hypothetical protein
MQTHREGPETTQNAWVTIAGHDKDLQNSNHDRRGVDNYPQYNVGIPDPVTQ